MTVGMTFLKLISNTETVVIVEREKSFPVETKINETTRIRERDGEWVERVSKGKELLTKVEQINHASATETRGIIGASWNNNIIVVHRSSKGRADIVGDLECSNNNSTVGRVEGKHGGTNVSTKEGNGGVTIVITVDPCGVDGEN